MNKEEFLSKIKKFKGYIVLGTILGSTILSSNVSSLAYTKNVKIEKEVKEENDEELKEAIEKNVEELKGRYNRCMPEHYYDSDYKELYNICRKGIKAIRKSKTIEEAEKNRIEYYDKIGDVKTNYQILREYIEDKTAKLNNNFKQYHKRSFTEKQYEQLQVIMEECVDALKEGQTKTEVYECYVSCKELVLNKVREFVINRVSKNFNGTEEELKIIIENINNCDNMTDMDIVADEENEFLSVEQVNNKIKKLVKKYPKMKDKEIRSLVVGANMDFLDDEAIYEILDINDKSELEEWSKTFDKAMKYLCKISKGINVVNKVGGIPTIYDELLEEIDYDDVVKVYELFFDKNMIKHSQYMCELIEDMMYEPIPSGTNDSCKGIEASFDIMAWFYDYYRDGYDKFKKGHIYERNDIKLVDTSSGYVVNRYVIRVFDDCFSWHVEQFIPSSDCQYLDDIDNYVKRLESPYAKKIVLEKAKKII